MLFIGDKRLIPAPFVTINRQANLASDGQTVSTTFRILLNGTLLPNKGSPLSNGWFYGYGSPPDENFVSDEDRFDSILKKQEQLRETLGQLQTSGIRSVLKWHPPGGSPIECYPKLISIDFSPGTWVNICNYNIELEAPSIQRQDTDVETEDIAFGASGLYLRQVSDTWQVKERGDVSGIMEITRNVSAVGFAAPYVSGLIGSEPWLNAKTWVENRLADVPLGTDTHFVSIPTGNQYNLITEENIDKVGGSYSISQRYLFSPNNYIEKRSISRNLQPSGIFGNGSPTIETITVNGTIEGLLPSGNDGSGKLANALTYWNNTLKDLLPIMVGANGSGIRYNVQEDYDNGILQYSVEFINNSGTHTYTHTYGVSFDYGQNASPTVSIQGTIEGLTSDGYYGPNDRKFNRAVTGWITIQPTIKSLAFAYGGTLFGNAASYSGLFTNEPITKSISFNKDQGTINYNFTFNYLDSGSGHLFSDQYSVEYNTSNALSDTHAGLSVTATIQGTIIGLASGDDPTTKVANAVTGWNTIKNQLYTRAQSDFFKLGTNTPNLVNRVVNRTFGINRVAGIINYSATYNNAWYKDAPTGVAIFDINIDQTLPARLVVPQIIPGRAAGPIIQNINTFSERRRTVNVALTMYPKGTGNYWEYNDISTPRSIASGFLASGVSDLGTQLTGWFLVGQSENWDWKNGFYTTTYNIVSPS